MPRRTPPGFSVDRKKFGLTYSCPVNADNNPIESREELLELLVTKFGECDYIICTEQHENGKNHYHAWLKFNAKVRSTSAAIFDLKGVHPNCIDPGQGWKSYVVKQGEYITNCYETNPYSEALRKDTFQEAINYLWEKRPRDMALSAHNIEENLRKKFKPPVLQKRFYGPFPHYFYPGQIVEDQFVHADFDPTTHSLLLVGPPGIGKTQFARYMLGDCDYVKSKLETLRTCRFDKPILFDEVCMLGAKIDPEESKEITDVENGGTIKARYKDIAIPCGIKRIFCTNMEHPFRNPNEAVYGRRVHSHVIRPPGPILGVEAPASSTDQFGAQFEI